MSKMQKWAITFAVGAIIWFIPVPAGLKPQAWHLFAVFVATIIGFILQPMPIGGVALTAIGLTGLFGILKPAEILTGFSATVMWLIVAAFLFAKGFIVTGLGNRVAYTIMAAIGDSSLKMAYAIALSDLVVSPATPSNTARGGGIIYPIVISLSKAFGSEPGPTARKLGAFMMSSSFQVNCITSAMFITAVAPNSLCVMLAGKAGVDISWGTWALAAVVPGLIAIALTPLIIYKMYPPEIKKTPEAKEIAQKEIAAMGPIKFSEKVVAGTFILALIMWATASLTKIDATVTAIFCVSVMLILGAIQWKDVLEEKGAWDTLMWMGSLITLAGALDKVGFIGWFAKLIGASMAGASWMMAIVVLFGVYLYSHYAFASLSAHVTAMYAAFLAVAIAAGAPPFLAAMGLGVISAFMGCLTHYATGPAPIYFGAGYVSQGEFWKIGFVMSVINIICFLMIGPVWWKVVGLW